MAHKPECPKSKDANAACTLNCEAAPAPTQTCWDCETEVGASEEKCPKCGADLKTAKAEDDVVTKSLARLKKKNAAAKKKAAPGAPPTTTPAKPKSPLLGLGKLLK